jgi:hypothetical protein
VSDDARIDRQHLDDELLLHVLASHAAGHMATEGCGCSMCRRISRALGRSVENVVGLWLLLDEAEQARWLDEAPAEGREVMADLLAVVAEAGTDLFDVGVRIRSEFTRLGADHDGNGKGRRHAS